MVIQNTYPNLSNIVHTDFELGRVIQTVTAADPGITDGDQKIESVLDKISLKILWTNIREKQPFFMRIGQENSSRAVTAINGNDFNRVNSCDGAND